MGKKKDKLQQDTGTGVSGADTFSLDTEAWDTAKERKEWGKRTGGLLPTGDYVGKVVKCIRSATKPGGTTAGSPMFSFQVRIMEGDQQGRVGFPRMIAHANTAGRYLAGLEAMGYDLSEIKQAAIPVPKASDNEGNVKEWVGKDVLLHVTVKKGGRTVLVDGKEVKEDSNEFAMSPLPGAGKKNVLKIAR